MLKSDDDETGETGGAVPAAEPVQEQYRHSRSSGHPVADVHGMKWFKMSKYDLPLNGNIPFRQWLLQRLTICAWIPSFVWPTKLLLLNP